MKKLFLFLSFVSSGPLCYGQNTFPASGNVGIGTMSPEYTLHSVANGNTNNAAAFLYGQYYGTAIGVNSTGLSYYAFEVLNGTNLEGSGGNTIFFVGANGNVGIGTSQPAYKLDVQGGDINTSNGYAYRVNGQYGLFWDANHSGTGIGSANPYSVNIYSNSTSPRVSINTNGNVGIGTTSPQSLLSVNGIVTAKQVTVTQTGWPDFVFDPTYRLPTLTTTAAYIKSQHHLPDIPPAKEIEKIGLNLGEMQKKQLQKIEELTLYQINSDKKIDLLENELKAYKQELTDLKKEISHLKRIK